MSHPRALASSETITPDVVYNEFGYDRAQQEEDNKVAIRGGGDYEGLNNSNVNDTTHDLRGTTHLGAEQVTFGYHLRQCCSIQMIKISYTRELQLEMLFSLLVGLFGNIIIKFIIQMSINQRDVPYQITQNSLDVIINLMYNNSLIQRNEQTVPTNLLYIIGVYIPLIIFLFGCIVAGWSMQRHLNYEQYSSSFTLLDGHSAFCMFFIAVGSNSFVTEFVKRYVGYLRPNFYQMCEYDIATMECTVDDEDGRKSFPSGHSSLAFCGMVCVALYITGKVGLFHQWQQPTKLLHSAASTNRNEYTTVNTQQPHPLAAPLWKKIVALATMGIPLMIATFVAASRVHDNYHHPADVITGAVIGSSCAMFVYHLWYPSIFSPYAGFPYCSILPSQL